VTTYSERVSGVSEKVLKKGDQAAHLRAVVEEAEINKRLPELPVMSCKVSYILNSYSSLSKALT